jgi:hypothetical protein
VVDAMVVLLDRDGKPVRSFGTGGKVLSDLGGPGDASYGVEKAVDCRSVTVAGYKGASTDATDGSKDDAAISRISL